MEQSEFDSKKYKWLCRLGGILLRNYPDHKLTADAQTYKMTIYKGECSACVHIDDGGSLVWDSFWEGGFDSDSLAEECGREYFEPIVAQIEKAYYDPNLAIGKEPEDFELRLHNGEYKDKPMGIGACLLYILLFLAMFVGSVYLSCN